MELINTISTSRVWTRHGLKITYAISILLLLLAITSVAWQVRSQQKLKASNYAPQKIAPIRKNSKPSYQINNVVHANLFGDPNPKKPVQKNAPKTTLNLKLQGVLSASDETIARAIIASGSGASKLYSIGDKIKGSGVSIKEIRADEVLLNRNGAIESLPLVKSKVSSKGDNSIISYTKRASGSISNAKYSPPATQASTISRSTPRPRSANGEPRKIKKPNFSGLDRALEKMGEI